MRIAEIIDAIFQKDTPAVRAAFDFLLANNDTLKSSVVGSVEKALVIEVCAFLVTDEEQMHENLCSKLKLPIGSKFSQGALKVVKSYLSGCGQDSARSDH